MLPFICNLCNNLLVSERTECFIFRSCNCYDLHTVTPFNSHVSTFGAYNFVTLLLHGLAGCIMLPAKSVSSVTEERDPGESSSSNFGCFHLAKLPSAMSEGKHRRLITTHTFLLSQVYLFTS